MRDISTGRREHGSQQGAPVRARCRRVWHSAFQRVFENPFRPDIERNARLITADHNRPPCAQSMPNAKLVPRIGIVDRHIGNDEIGQKQFLKHVGEDIAGPVFEIRAEDIGAGLRDRWFNELPVNLIEVDFQTARIHLLAKTALQRKLEAQ